MSYGIQESYQAMKSNFLFDTIEKLKENCDSTTNSHQNEDSDSFKNAIQASDINIEEFNTILDLPHKITMKPSEEESLKCIHSLPDELIELLRPNGVVSKQKQIAVDQLNLNDGDDHQITEQYIERMDANLSYRQIFAVHLFESKVAVIDNTISIDFTTFFKYTKKHNSYQSNFTLYIRDILKELNIDCFNMNYVFTKNHFIIGFFHKNYSINFSTAAILEEMRKATHIQYNFSKDYMRKESSINKNKRDVNDIYPHETSYLIHENSKRHSHSLETSLGQTTASQLPMFAIPKMTDKAFIQYLLSLNNYKFTATLLLKCPPGESLEETRMRLVDLFINNNFHKFYFRNNTTYNAITITSRDPNLRTLELQCQAFRDAIKSISQVQSPVKLKN